MAHPLLDLDQDWHRQRAQLRAGRLRPPPLVMAGLDLSPGSDSTAPIRVQVLGLAIIYGIFPATAAEFLGLARTWVRQDIRTERAELAGVLKARIQAVWAWLPTLQQDCYLELDHATDLARMWLVGPGAGEGQEIDIERESAFLDEAFLAALIMTSNRNWGGSEGLERLVERFGRRPLLIAAQVSDVLERVPQDPQQALDIARRLWTRLDADDETAWEPLVEEESAWVCVQLGRLALRLGLTRAARLLLGRARHADVPHIAAFDLGQACEALDDLNAAAAAFTQYTTHRSDDPDGWRRLLFCQLRLSRITEAENCLRAYRAAGGEERDVIERAIVVLRRPLLPLLQRAQIVGWLCARLSVAMGRYLPLAGLVASLSQVQSGARLRPAPSTSPDRTGLLMLPALVRSLGEAFRDIIGPSTGSSVEVDRDAVVESACRVVLLGMPFLAPAPGRRSASQAAAHALLALSLWRDHGGQPAYRFDSVTVRGCLLDLGRIISGTR